MYNTRKAAAGALTGSRSEAIGRLKSSDSLITIPYWAERGWGHEKEPIKADLETSVSSSERNTKRPPVTAIYEFAMYVTEVS